MSGGEIGPGLPHGTRGFIHHLKSAPPISALRSVLERLEGEGLVVALGGSGLLAALGLADRVRDWDLTTDGDADRVAAILAGKVEAAHGPGPLHADRKLVLAGGAVEVIVGLAFQCGGGRVRIPTLVSGRADGIPLGSPEGWAVAYHLLGREQKRDALLQHLERHGADAGAVAGLVREPLPEALAARLTALPVTGRG